MQTFDCTVFGKNFFEMVTEKWSTLLAIFKFKTSIFSSNFSANHPYLDLKGVILQTVLLDINVQL